VAGRFRLRPFDYQVERGRWLRALPGRMRCRRRSPPSTPAPRAPRTRTGGRWRPSMSPNGRSRDGV